MASALLLGFAAAALAGSVALFSPDMATVCAVSLVFRVYRPIRVSALLSLVVVVSSMHLPAVSFVVMSVLEHFGGLEFLIRPGMRDFSVPVLFGAALLALATRERPDETTPGLTEGMPHLRQAST